MHPKCKQQNILSDLVDIHLTFICWRAKRFRIAKKRVSENVNRCARAKAATIYIYLYLLHLLIQMSMDFHPPKFSSQVSAAWLCVRTQQAALLSSPLWKHCRCRAAAGLAAGFRAQGRVLVPPELLGISLHHHVVFSGVGLVLAGSWSLPWQHEPNVSDRCN